MPTLLALFLLAGIPFFALADTPAKDTPAKDARSAEEARQDADREALIERRRRAVENLKRFSWVELGPRPEHEWIGEPISLSLRDADLVLRSSPNGRDSGVSFQDKWQNERQY